MDSVRIFVGFDPREAIAYHAFCQSVIERAAVPVSFHPLHTGMLGGFNGQRDGTNAFIFSRYLIPQLCSYTGWAIFCDGDMVVDRDIQEIWNLRHQNIFDKAVCLVKHDYQSRHPRKYIGSKLESGNLNYPRKNWSSVMLWNCAHMANRILTREFVSEAGGAFLHRFQWLKDTQIGELPRWWNHLVREEGPAQASLYHYTLGVPGIKHYADDYASWKWHGSVLRSLACAGEDPVELVKRAQDRLGAVS